MKEFKKIFLFLLTVLLLIGSLYSTGWAGDQLRKDDTDTMAQGWSLLDVLVARPLSVLAGVGGSAIFVVTLPFTLPSKTANDAANMFIVQPFQFAFRREIPPEDMFVGKDLHGGNYDR